MKVFRFFSIMALVFFKLGLQGQTVEEMNRFFIEKDWTPWSKALNEDPSKVKKLFIKAKTPVDYEGLRAFGSLTGLIIIDSPLPNLDFLKDYPNLEILELEGNSLKSLEGIQVLKNLKEFSCNYNFIKDIGPLDSLLNLTSIKLYDNEIGDIAPIAHLENVRHLDLSKNLITTIEPIKHWTSLKVFSVYKCDELHDISIIKNFKELSDLNISFLDIPGFSLSIVDSMTGLQNLRIQGMVNSNEELKHIMYHTDLEQITMGKNDSVTCIDSLRYLSKMKYLDIHSNNVSDISVVRNFPYLVKIVMYRNHITDITPLLNCPELRSVFMFENPVANYSPLFQMSYLQYLHLSEDAFDKNQQVQLKRALRNTSVSFF